MFDDTLKKLERIEPLINIVDNQEITAMSRFLYERISNHDSYLVFLGETSSGKSSVINGFLGADILPMKACPSTAAITEVEINSNVSSDEFYAINKNATIEKIDKEMFLQLSEHPDNNLKRLKVIRNVSKKGFDNLRIFDTPGYGSIIEEHEEVLKDFLPNSDIIVYTVNYKIGIQDEDYVFLSFLRELVRPDVKIFLLVNRCPSGIDSKSMKVRKIARFVSDILTIDPIVFTIENIETEESIGHALPNNENLWNKISQLLSTPERIKSLETAFDGYIHDLYNECYKIIESRYVSARLDTEEFEVLKKAQQDSAFRIRHSIPEFVVPAFEKIDKALPTKFHEVRDNVEKTVESEIEATSCTCMEEAVSYTNSHLLPHTIKTETAEIQHYIDIELDDLNRKVDDYLQKEFVKFNNEITIILQTNVGAATSAIVANILKNVGRNSLEGYFFTYGGMGGANAGIANAASHILKKAGDLFGHTFSRATHNGLKHFLSKIGATSMKAVGAAVAVVTELLFVAYQMATWKGSLLKQVIKGLDKWEDKTLDTVRKDLANLREENIETIRKIADDIAHTFDEEQPKDLVQCKENLSLAKKIGDELGIA